MQSIVTSINSFNKYTLGSYFCQVLFLFLETQLYMKQTKPCLVVFNIQKHNYDDSQPSELWGRFITGLSLHVREQRHRNSFLQVTLVAGIHQLY